MIEFPQIKQCTNPSCSYTFKKNEIQYQIKIYSKNNPLYAGIFCLKCYDIFKNIFAYHLNYLKFCGHYEQSDSISILLSDSKIKNRLFWCLKCFLKAKELKQMFLVWEDFSNFLQQIAKELILGETSQELTEYENTVGCITYERLALIIKDDAKEDFSLSELKHSIKCKKCAELIIYIQALQHAVKITPLHLGKHCPPAKDLVRPLQRCLLYLSGHKNKIKKPLNISKHFENCSKCKNYVEEIIDKTITRSYFLKNH